MATPTPSKSPIKDIKHKLLHPALTSHYQCYFPFPEGKNGDFNNLLKSNGIANKSDAIDTLMLFCSEASLPGSQLNTHELNNDYTGVTQRHAYRRLYDDRADFTFYVDINYTPIRVFEAWMRYISGEQITNSARLNNHYRIRYPKYYKTTIYITKFERSFHSEKTPNKSSMTYSFFNAFPLSVTSMPVSYDSSQLLKCTVSFTYDRYVQSQTGLVGTSDEPFVETPPDVPNVGSNSSYWNTNTFGSSNIDFSIATNLNSNLSGLNALNTNIAPSQNNRQVYGPAFESNEEANRQAAILRGENVQ